MRIIISALAALTAITAFAAHPVEELLDRIDPGASKKFVIRQVESPVDFFEISADRGKPAITGNSAVNIAAGLNWYLKYYPHIHLSWNNMHAELPDALPLPQRPERHETTATRRYYMNYCSHSYSMAFWDWDRWQQEIDWMALHGINMPLAITGTDVVWANTLRRLGYNDEEIASFVAGPAFQAWWLMNNLEGWGGPNDKKWYADRAALQRKILARMRRLGMEPVLPGYSGMVPHDADERLGCQVSGKGIWNGFTRPAFLKTDDPLFERISSIYYDELTRLCGKSKYYSMDPFHEGGSLEGVDLAQCGGIIAKAMKRANPEAVWVIQGWNENPRARLLEGVDKGDIVVLDLASEIKPNWGDPETPSPYKRPDGFWPHDWMYCMLLNFGGNVGLHGRMDCVIDGYYKARESKYGATLTGTGLTPEGIENNPVMYELQMELMWRPEKFSKEEWLKSYARARYGASDADIDSCWQRLGVTIYNCPSGNLQQGTTESVFCARPSENVWQVSSWSRMKPYYEPQQVIDAAAMFVKAADRFRNVENYRYDLVDIVRQAIAEKGRLTYQEMTTALAAADTAAFNNASQRFLTLIMGQDELLNTRPEFMVGRWINAARRLAPTPAQADMMEQNARLLITTWGPRVASEDGGLRDYGHREWAGLLADLHHKRWSRWIELKRKQMAENPQSVKNSAGKSSTSDDKTDFVTELPSDDKGKSADEIDFYAIDETWVNSRNHYPESPKADAVDTAVRLFATLVAGK